MGDGRGFLFGKGNAGLENRDVVAGQDLLGFVFGENGPTAAADILNYLIRKRSMGGLLLRILHEAGGFIKGAEVIGVTPHVKEGAGAGVRIIKSGDVAGVENSAAFLDLGAAHPTGEDGLSFEAGKWFQLPSGAGGVRHRLWGEND